MAILAWVDRAAWRMLLGQGRAQIGNPGLMVIPAPVIPCRPIPAEFA